MFLEHECFMRNLLVKVNFKKVFTSVLPYRKVTHEIKQSKSQQGSYLKIERYERTTPDYIV